MVWEAETFFQSARLLPRRAKLSARTVCVLYFCLNWYLQISTCTHVCIMFCFFQYIGMKVTVMLMPNKYIRFFLRYFHRRKGCVFFGN